MPAALLWLRRDLRLADNPALQALLDAGYAPVPVYIHDEPGGDWPLGEASAWWLHHSLTALQRSLRERGSDLLILSGDPKTLLPALLKQADSKRVAWNRCYEPAALTARPAHRAGAEKAALRDKRPQCRPVTGTMATPEAGRNPLPRVHAVLESSAQHRTRQAGDTRQ